MIPLSAPLIFREKRGLYYDNIATTGGIRLEKLATVPGGPVNLVFLNPRDERATLEQRNRVTDGGVTVGLNTDPHWYPGKFPSSWKDDNGRALPDPLLYRQQVSADVKRILLVGDPVSLDFEKCPHAWQLIFFVGEVGNLILGWRGKGGTWTGGANEFRPTACTNEPHQDHPAELYRQARVHYIAQLYDGNMNDRPAWQELQWDVGDGLDPLEVSPCFDSFDYDPVDFVPGTYLFNQDRLPHLFTA